MQSQPTVASKSGRLRRWVGKVAGFLLRLGIMFVVVFPPLAAILNVYRPHVPVYDTPESVGLKFRDVEFATTDGLRLSGWVIPATTPRPKGALLVCHGVGANRVDVLPRASFLVPAGYTCLLFDFRAHGKSEGWRVGYGLWEARDVRAALDCLRREAPGLPIGVLAQSMGAAISIMAAAQSPEVRAYVLDSPYASLWEMARENFRQVPDWIGVPLQYCVSFWGSLIVGASVSEIEPQREVNGLLPRPVFFLHGKNDKLIPPEHSQRLHTLYSGPKELWLVPDAWHTASHSTHRVEFEEKVTAFFDRHVVLP